MVIDGEEYKMVLPDKHKGKAVCDEVTLPGGDYPAI